MTLAYGKRYSRHPHLISFSAGSALNHFVEMVKGTDFLQEHSAFSSRVTSEHYVKRVKVTDILEELFCLFLQGQFSETLVIVNHFNINININID
jgi:hypothetical protein